MRLGTQSASVPQSAASLDRASTTSIDAVEIPAAPASSSTNAVTEPTTDATAPPHAGVTESVAETIQIATLPETASDSVTVSGSTDIPAVPDVPVRGEVMASRSVAEAEAAGIDSKPRPVSDVAEPLIVISATDDSWVQVRNSDLSALLTRILRKGEHYKVPARPG